jgi:hypothetical protein
MPLWLMIKREKKKREGLMMGRDIMQIKLKSSYDSQFCKLGGALNSTNFDKSPFIIWRSGKKNPLERGLQPSNKKK